MWSFFSKDPTKDLVNYEIQEAIQLHPELQDKTIWSINNAKKKNASNAPQSNELFSVFSYQVRQGNESWLLAAKNGFKRMKMLRHPNILMFVDGVESDKGIFIATERVKPLYNYLNDSKESDSQKENEISYGLYQIATALSFLNNDCKLVHNNVCMSSVVVNRAGEWKLTGFEYCHSIEDQQAPIKVLHSLDVYEPPEKSPVNNLNTNRNSIQTESGVDSWGLGCLIWEIFNGVLNSKKHLQNPGSNMPNRILTAYQSLLNAQTNKRLNPAKFLSLCRQENGFMSNHFVDTLLFLEQIQIKDQGEKTKFFSELTQKLDDFPSQLCIYKILPQLLHAYEYGNAGSSVLAPLFKLGKLLEEAEYQKKIIPVVVKLFSSTDRTTRMRLLQQLELFVEHLSATIINDQIFPHICQGFSDANPAIRESTIRSIVLIAPKLNYNNMNVELMKHFARLQATDDQGMIRTNTTVCIGKIAPFINPQLRQRILLSAFPKAMRDPFPLARLSGVIALANTDRFYTLRDISSKVLPSLCTLCIDPEKDVRDETFKTIKIFLSKLEKVSESPELAIEYEKDVQSCDLNLKNETSWTSWAMTSLSTKMSGYKNKQQGPSVALNTQPLGPPPSLLPNSTSSLNASNSSSNLSDKIQKTDTPKKETSTFIKDKNLEEKSNKSNNNNNNNNNDNNIRSGWNDLEDEWKDLDDDDQMEPLEPLEPIIKPNLSTKRVDADNYNKSSNNNLKQNNDWSNWTNSFEDNQLNINDNQQDDVFNSNSKPQYPSASSYNWSNQNKYQNEEEMFNSLVKDVKNTNLANSKSNNSFSKSNNTNNSAWSNDWKDFDLDENKTKQKSERQQRNAEKQQENEAKMRQSKPLKLAQKKDPFNPFLS